MKSNLSFSPFTNYSIFDRKHPKDQEFAMDVTKGSGSAAPIYEDFVPTSEFVSDKDSDTLLIHLPGFKKEQLRVQLTRGTLRISGSIPVGDNKVRRFQKEFPVSPNCETNKITARFDSGVLHVKQPKLVTPATSIMSEQHQSSPPPRPPTPIPSSAPQEPKKPAIEPHATDIVAEKANRNKEGKEKDMGKQTCCSENEPSRNEEKTEAKTDGERKDKVSTRKEDGFVNTRIENYQKMVRAMGQRLKMQRRVVNAVLAAVLTCIVAIYVNNLITSSRQPTN